MHHGLPDDAQRLQSLGAPGEPRLPCLCVPGITAVPGIQEPSVNVDRWKKESIFAFQCCVFV